MTAPSAAQRRQWAIENVVERLRVYGVLYSKDPAARMSAAEAIVDAVLAITKHNADDRSRVDSQRSHPPTGSTAESERR